MASMKCAIFSLFLVIYTIEGLQLDGQRTYQYVRQAPPQQPPQPLMQQVPQQYAQQPRPQQQQQQQPQPQQQQQQPQPYQQPQSYAQQPRPSSRAQPQFLQSLQQLQAQLGQSQQQPTPMEYSLAVVQNVVDLLNPAFEVVRKGVNDLVTNTQEVLGNANARRT